MPNTRKLPKAYCNICQYETVQDQDGCIYHQRVLESEEGSYLKYDEFNQDGEEL